MGCPARRAPSEHARPGSRTCGGSVRTTRAGPHAIWTTLKAGETVLRLYGVRIGCTIHFETLCKVYQTPSESVYVACRRRFSIVHTLQGVELMKAFVLRTSMHLTRFDSPPPPPRPSAKATGPEEVTWSSQDYCIASLFLLLGVDKGKHEDEDGVNSALPKVGSCATRVKHTGR